MNKQLLKSYIMKHDGTQKNLADAMGIALQTLNAKINESGTEFNQQELLFIKKRYKLTDKEFCTIFFAV